MIQNNEILSLRIDELKLSIDELNKNKKELYYYFEKCDELLDIVSKLNIKVEDLKINLLNDETKKEIDDFNFDPFEVKKINDLSC